VLEKLELEVRPVFLFITSDRELWSKGILIIGASGNSKARRIYMKKLFATIALLSLLVPCFGQGDPPDPGIAVEPQNQTAPAGSSITLTVTASGTGAVQLPVVGQRRGHHGRHQCRLLFDSGGRHKCRIGLPGCDRECWELFRDCVQ
jgi:hypothetical protein